MINRKRLAAMPWRDILVANGIISLLIGACLLWVVGAYSGEMYTWIKSRSPDDFHNLLRLLVLLYIAYGLIILLIGLVWLLAPVLSAKLSGRETGGRKG